MATKDYKDFRYLHVAIEIEVIYFTSYCCLLYKIAQKNGLGVMCHLVFSSEKHLKLYQPYGISI